MVEELQAQSTQHITSTNKVEGGQGSTMSEANTSKDKEIYEVQKELESTSGQSAKSA
jgi:hypothetical protein